MYVIVAEIVVDNLSKHYQLFDIFSNVLSYFTNGIF